MTLVETIIAISLFVFMAAAIFATFILSLRTSKLAHLDLVAYNLASDLCGQMQAADFAHYTASPGPTTVTFTRFDKDPAKLRMAPLLSAPAEKPRATPYLPAFTYGRVNYVDVDTDAHIANSRATNYETNTTRFRFAVTPAYSIETGQTANGVSFDFVRLSVTVAFPPKSASGLPGWLSGESRRPVTVTALRAQTHAGSRYINTDTIVTP